MTHDPDSSISNYSEPAIAESLSIDAPASARVAAVFSFYRQETGIDIPASPSPAERRAVRNWLVEKQIRSDPAVWPMLWTKVSRLTPVVLPDLASKTSWLQQSYCPTCTALDVSPLSIHFGIRVKPFSAQAQRRLLPKIKLAINEYLRGKFHDIEAWAGCALCVTIVATISKADRLKDVDNLAKGLLDAMQGPIYKDDRLIQHLSIHRVMHDGPDGWYKIRVMPVTSDDEDVVDSTMNVSWAGQPEIVIDPERETSDKMSASSPANGT